MARARRKYGREFMERAVELATSPGASVTATAKGLGVPQKTLDGWVKRRRVVAAGGGGGVCDDPAILRARLKEMEERVRRLEVEKDILKKATAFFAGETRP